MVWATTTTKFFTFCRSGEIIIPKGKAYDPQSNLSYGNISVDNAHDLSVVTFLLKQLKANQAREGVKYTWIRLEIIRIYVQ